LIDSDAEITQIFVSIAYYFFVFAIHLYFIHLPTTSLMISPTKGVVMDWNAQIGRELRELDGIVAILLSLAALATRAAGSPYPIRCAVFWFIRQADMVATEFVVGSASGAARAQWLTARMPTRDGYNPIDESDLALSLGSLAQAVAAMVAQIRRQVFLHRAQPLGGNLDRGRQHGAAGVFGMTVPQVGRSDTS
jgi:hypothetical protein